VTVEEEWRERPKAKHFRDPTSSGGAHPAWHPCMGCMLPASPATLHLHRGHEARPFPPLIRFCPSGRGRWPPQEPHDEPTADRLPTLCPRLTRENRLTRRAPHPLQRWTRTSPPKKGGPTSACVCCSWPTQNDTVRASRAQSRRLGQRREGGHSDAAPGAAPSCRIMPRLCHHRSTASLALCRELGLSLIICSSESISIGRSSSSSHYSLEEARLFISAVERRSQGG